VKLIRKKITQALILTIVTILLIHNVQATPCTDAGGHASEECAITDAELAAYNEASTKCCMNIWDANVQNPSLYTSKEIFFIPDTSWQDALRFLPVTIWTQKNQSIVKYPYLIYHTEGTTTQVFDLDSPIHFCQLYKPNRATLLASAPTTLKNLLIADSSAGQVAIQQNPNGYLGCGLQSSQIVSVPSANYYSYWSRYETVVVTASTNYQGSLMAAVFASYLHSPLLFVSSESGLIDPEGNPITYPGDENILR
jgi:hypothetical protein